MKPVVVTVALAIIALAAPAHADPLQDQLAAAARAVPREVYAFRRTLTIEQTSSPRKVIVEQFDPRRAAADRWSLVSSDGRAPNAKDLDKFRKAKRGKTPSYADLADWIAGPATRADGPAGYVVYRYVRLPSGAVKINSRDISENLRAEVLVNTKGRTPYVEHIRMTLAKGFTMMLVASLKSMSVDQRYRLTADGQPFPGDMASDIGGSMMGKSGSVRTTASYTDVQKVR